MKAILRNYRQSPRKVRLVATYLKGKPVSFVLATLPGMAKRATTPLYSLVASAVANAKAIGSVDEEALYIKDIRVDGARTLKRARSRSRGMSNPIKKRASHIYVELGLREVKAKKESKKAEPKTKKAKATK